MRESTSWPCASCPTRSEEHTSELQSHVNLVCRLLLEKKKQKRALSPSSATDHTDSKTSTRSRVKQQPVSLSQSMIATFNPWPDCITTSLRSFSIATPV